jgi:hypothetical protein
MEQLVTARTVNYEIQLLRTVLTSPTVRQANSLLDIGRFRQIKRRVGKREKVGHSMRV